LSVTPLIWTTLPRAWSARARTTGLVVKAHRLLYHSTLGLRVIKKKTKDHPGWCAEFVVKGSGFRGWGLFSFTLHAD